MTRKPSPRRPKRADIKTLFGVRVRAAREEQGLSQTALAARIGGDAAMISQIERGTRNLSIDTMQRVADALDLEPWEMIRPDPPPGR